MRHPHAAVAVLECKYNYVTGKENRPWPVAWGGVCG
jgi:hypothetical protein